MIRNAGETKKRIYLIAGVFFAVLLMGALFSYVDPVWAADGATQAADANLAKTGNDNGWFMTAVKAIVYGVFVLFGWMAGIAMTIFTAFVNPELFQVLNSQGVYSMWQFIRDFFNLFFILTLLYIAFTTIFQVSKDYKKALLNLVIMALLVNFSFPISRFLIDAGNVPMYYFANQIDPRGAAAGMGKIFSASEIQGILLFGSSGNDNQVTFDSAQKLSFEHLFAATVFLFIFAITLLVLAVMFVIRFAVLVVLVIFSSVGFAGTVIPGMNKYASQWWESFAQYVLYGPAAMLMVLVAVRFFDALATSNASTIIYQTATNMSDKEVVNFMASAATFSIPIVMLWIAIGLSSKMSIAGSAAVTGAGFTAIAWARKKTVGGVVGGAKWAAYRNPVARGVGQGLKQNLNEGNMFGLKYGKIPGVGKLLTGNYWKEPSATEARMRGAVGTSTVEKEMAGRHRKMVNERMAEDKKNNVSVDDHLATLNDVSNDPVEREAAALALVSEKELRTTEQLTKALQVFSASGNKNAMVRAIENAKDGVTAGLDNDSYGKIANSLASNPDAVKALDSKLKKEGNIHVKIEHEVAQAGGDAAKIEGIYEDNLKMSSEDFAKQGGIHAAIGKNADLTKYMKKRVSEDKDFYQEAIKKIKTGDGREKMRTLVESSGQDKAVRDKMKQVKSENAR